MNTVDVTISPNVIDDKLLVVFMVRPLNVPVKINLPIKFWRQVCLNIIKIIATHEDGKIADKSYKEAFPFTKFDEDQGAWDNYEEYSD